MDIELYLLRTLKAHMNKVRLSYFIKLLLIDFINMLCKM